MKRSSTMLLSAAAIAGIGLLVSGCSSKLSPEPFDANQRLTAGQLKMAVKVGVTTQNEVYEALGTPNVVAVQSGKGEIWTYDQIKVRRSNQGYGAGAFFATLFPYSGNFNRNDMSDFNGGGAAGVEASGNVGTMTTSVRTATLVVRFDTAEKVSSYNMLVTSF